MESHNYDLYKGLRMMYLGELVAVIALVVGLLILLIPGLAALGLLLILAAAVGVVISVVGLVRLRKLSDDYMSALIVLVIAFICGMIADNISGALSSLLDMVSSVLGLAQIYFVVRATNAFLIPAGREDVAGRGKKALYVQVASVAVSLVVSVLALAAVSSGNEGAIFGVMVLLLIPSLMSIAASIMYLIYLKDSAQAFW